MPHQRPDAETPISAMTKATLLATTTVAASTPANVRKRISRVSRAVGTVVRGDTTKSRPITRTSHTRRGSLKNPATVGASSASSAANARPVTTLSQKTLVQCRLLDVLALHQGVGKPQIREYREKTGHHRDHSDETEVGRGQKSRQAPR